MSLPATFRCDRQAMTLTAAGCARLWESANGARVPDPGEGRARCRGCPIGARNAGAPVPKCAETVARDSIAQTCARCWRSAERGDRRQGLVKGRLCASCDMRDREAAAGRNAKGNPPALMGLLHSQAVAAIRLDTKARACTTFDRVTCPMEAAVLAARKAGGPVALGRGGPPFALPRGWQFEMPL